MSTHSSMDSNLNFRMSSHDKQIIETAARLNGLKPNTYARQKLLEVAQKDISKLSKLNTLVTSETDWEFFIAIMEAPIIINQRLKKAVKHFNKKFGP